MIKSPDKTQEINNLELALKHCQDAAERGYLIAKTNINESSEAINKVSKSLSDCLKGYDNKSIRTTGVVEQLKQQLTWNIPEK